MLLLDQTSLWGFGGDRMKLGQYFDAYVEKVFG